MSQFDAKSVNSSPFIPSTLSVSQVMRTVIYALIPGVLIYVWWFGFGVGINIILAIASALIFEFAMLVIRNRPVAPYLFDGSAVVTAILLALAMPPLLPWWLPVLGSFFAIVVAKHLYGGLGYNTFNPAMAAYAVLLISFPLEFSRWAAPMDLIDQPLSLVQILNYSFYQQLPSGLSFDAVTAATPLDYLRTETGLGRSVSDISQASIFGQMAGVGMEWVNVGFLLGGIWLIYRRIISWHIPVAVLSSLFAIASCGYFINAEHYEDPLFHLMSGASILCAFFIATDPVTASTTPLGRIIYGIGIGLLIFSIRSWGGYPDGVAFAVLLMGLCVPLLDHYTAPKVYGARRKFKDRHGNS